MDTALYTLIGVLGGVIVTQISNYFIEGKRAKIKMDEMILDIQHSKNIDLQQDRKNTYASYLSSLDKSIKSNPPDLSLILDDYYRSLILSGDDVNKAVRHVFNILRVYNSTDQKDIETFRNAKGELLTAMRNELQD